MHDQLNLILTIAISLIILVSWQMYFKPRPRPTTSPLERAAVAVPFPGALSVSDRQGTPVAEWRVRIDTAALRGSISLTGLRFDDITLTGFHEKPDRRSPEIKLLFHPSAPTPYYIEQGWLASDGNVKVPTGTTVWTVDDAGAVLTDTQPLIAHWDNGTGLRFTRTIRADGDFMFTVEQTVENMGESAVTLYPYSLVARFDKPKTDDVYLYLRHEGPVGVFNDTLKEVDYDDLRKDGRQSVESTGGWIGITDKYWLAAVAQDQQSKVTASFNLTQSGGRDRYQTDLRGEAMAVPPGESRTFREYVFAGAKEVPLLERYAESPGIVGIDRAVDWGWFRFLTKPFFHALLWFKNLLGSFGLAILAFTTVLRLLMFPLAYKQSAAMSKLKALQPQTKALYDRHANNKTKLNAELMELYKREKANPLSGCLPVLIQIPIIVALFALYKVLLVVIEVRHAPFYGWINDLSAPDPTNVFNLFGILAFTPPTFLHLGALSLIYGLTIWLTLKVSPQPTDPVQARIMMLMPILIMFMMATVPAGVVIFWIWSAVLNILQQWILLRVHATPATAHQP